MIYLAQPKALAITETELKLIAAPVATRHSLKRLLSHLKGRIFGLACRFVAGNSQEI